MYILPVDQGAKPHVVIVGAGFAGLNVARALHKALPRPTSRHARITVIDRSNHHLFQPLLYQVATAGLSPAQIAVPVRAVLRSFPEIAVLMGEVVGVDRSAKQVRLKDLPPVTYDYLVIGTGARHGYFGHDEWEAHAPGLKSLADATRIRQRILFAFEVAEAEPDPAVRESLLTFVVVGGGPTGVEMAGSIAELAHAALARDFRRIDPRQAKIILMEAGPRVLAGFPEELSKAASRALEKLGVEIRPEARVEKVDAQGVWLRGALLPARTVIWAAGVVASGAGSWLGASVDRAGRVQVEKDLSVPGHREILVLGDTAAFIQDGKPLPGVAPVAMQQGRYAGKLLAARIRGQAAPPPFHYVDKGNLATVGRKYAIADLGRARLTGFVAWVAWLVIHIYYLIGFRSKIVVMIDWAWSYFTFERGARLITDEESPFKPGAR
jgi:NADH dehydrogenase